MCRHPRVLTKNSDLRVENVHQADDQATPTQKEEEPGCQSDLACTVGSVKEDFATLYVGSCPYMYYQCMARITSVC